MNTKREHCGEVVWPGTSAVGGEPGVAVERERETQLPQRSVMNTANIESVWRTLSAGSSWRERPELITITLF